METLEGRMLLTAVVTGIPFAGVEAGSTGAISVASFTTSQPSPDPADYTATINWGDGASSSGSVSIVPNGRGGFDVVGYHTYAAVGTYGVGITVNSLYDATTASAATTATVSAASTISLDVWSMVTSGNVMTGQLSVATFTDSDPGSAPGIYTATIDWGDGTQSVGNVLAGGVGSVGDWRVQGAHLFAAAGHYTTWVTVSSIYGEWVTAGGDTTVQAFQSIAAVGTPVTGTQGTAATGTLATFTGSDPLAGAADYAATIDWGDGSTSSGTIVAGALGGWEVRGAHAYATPGSKAVSVTITGGGGAIASVNTTATIANPAMHGSGVNMSGLRAHTWTDRVAHFSDGNPVASAGDYAVTIDWGDGQSSAGTVAANSDGGWDVTGTHAYAVPGTFAVATTITDGDGGTVTTTSTAVPRSPRPALPSGRQGG